MAWFSPSSTRKKSRKRGRRTRRSSVLQVSTTSTASPVGLPAGALLLFGGLTLMIVVYGLVLLFGWFGELLFTGNERFTIRTVAARSDGVLPEAMLLEWSGVAKGDNLYEIDLAEVRHRLEKHAIVKRAVVKRRLPATLSITVNERVPIARMGRVEGTMNWLVDREGVLIQKSFQSKHLPFVLGVRQNVTLGDSVAEGPAAPVLAYLEILKDMPAKKRDLLEVHVVSVGHPDFLIWDLRSGIRLRMPREGDFRKVLERASRMVYASRVENRDLEFFDLLPEGPNKIGAAE